MSPQINEKAAMLNDGKLEKTDTVESCEDRVPMFNPPALGLV